MSGIITRINEDFIDDEIIDDSTVSMDVRQNVQWLMAGIGTNIDFNAVNEPIYKVNSFEDLYRIINSAMNAYGINCNLNWIDVSHIDNMVGLFSGTHFDGDISKWDVSNVTDMRYMFQNSQFNGNISEWNISNVKHMDCMFRGSIFNKDISSWNVKFKTTEFMFSRCPIKNEFKPFSMQSRRKTKK